MEPLQTDAPAAGDEPRADGAHALTLQLLLDALARRAGQPAAAEHAGPIVDLDGWSATGTLGGRRLALAGAFIAPARGDGAWYATKAALERRLAEGRPGGHVLWLPPGADLPAREPHRSDLIMRAEEVAGRLVAGGHGEVRFPVELVLRKSDEEGSYLTARGGLANVWARFTGRVFGHYQLDSTELHRPPAGEGHVERLIEAIVAQANQLQLGQSALVPAEDAWILQRLRAGEGWLIVGEPPGETTGTGAPLRRTLRRTMQALRSALFAEPAELRVVVLIGAYTHFAEQPVGAALLGFDPSLYAGIDQILLAADGEVAPIIDLSRSPLLNPEG